MQGGVGFHYQLSLKLGQETTLLYPASASPSTCELPTTDSLDIRRKDWPGHSPQHAWCHSHITMVKVPWEQPSVFSSKRETQALPEHLGMC